MKVLTGTRVTGIELSPHGAVESVKTDSGRIEAEVVVIACGIYGFARLVIFQTRAMTSKTSRRAEDLYDSYTDSPRRRRRKA